MDDLLAAAGFSRRQVDRLGEALRSGEPTAEDAASFNRYREAFRPALDEAMAILGSLTSAAVVDRQKTLRSTVAKLRRETSRMSQIQDIAGCRVVVPSVFDQDALSASLLAGRANWRLYDRRSRPSHGYRSVHVIAMLGGFPVEIQVRTELQHAWAEVSEGWDRVHPGVKYGAGPEELMWLLSRSSALVATFEDVEPALAQVGTELASLDAKAWRELFDTVRESLEDSDYKRELLEAGPGPEGPAALATMWAARRTRLHDEMLNLLRTILGPPVLPRDE